MNVTPYTKAIATGATGLLGIVTTTTTLVDVLPPEYTWVAATAGVMTSATVGIQTFLTWLSRNEPTIQADADKAGVVVGDFKAVVADAEKLRATWKADLEALAHSPATLKADAEKIVHEVESIPAAVKKVVAEAKSEPAQAASDAVSVAATVAGAADDAVKAVESAPADAAVPAAPVAAESTAAKVVDSATAIVSDAKTVEAVVAPVIAKVEDILKAHPIR